MDSRWPAHRPPWAPSAQRSRGPRWRRPGGTSNNGSTRSRPTAHQAGSLSSIPCRACCPGSQGGDPAPRGGRGAEWACRLGGTSWVRPSVRAITPPSARRSPAGGDARLALVRWDARKGAAAGTRAGCGAPVGPPDLSEEGAWSSGAPEAGEDSGLAVPTLPRGGSQLLTPSPPSLGHGPRAPVAGASAARGGRPGFPVPPPGRDGGVPKERGSELQFDHALAQHREICER